MSWSSSCSRMWFAWMKSAGFTWGKEVFPAARGASGCFCSSHTVPDCFPALWQSLGGFFQQPHHWGAPGAAGDQLQLRASRRLKKSTSNCALSSHRVKPSLRFPLQDQLPMSSRCQQTTLAFFFPASSIALWQLFKLSWPHRLRFDYWYNKNRGTTLLQ